MGTKQNRTQNCKKDQLLLCKYIKNVELYYYYIFIELLMYFCYNTSYVF